MTEQGHLAEASRLAARAKHQTAAGGATTHAVVSIAESLAALVGRLSAAEVRTRRVEVSCGTPQKPQEPICGPNSPPRVRTDPPPVNASQRRTEPPAGPNTRISRQQWLTQQTLLTAQRGTCNRLQVGAILVRDERITANGYNGTPAGDPHCNHVDDTPCDAACHAEENIIVFCARHGITTNDAHLIVTHAPCLRCARMIINAGITKVTYLTPYRSDAGLTYLRAHPNVTLTAWDTNSEGETT